ncbi:hypothetical protein FRX31_005869 [Thalictrum thalictroides]|uniref:Uncharacterized protein n=1 Tax=Thalictrum thalictroides TaxID=46969 RepID=A0A7J6X660_THATH|nr:hypothetical protein FRX31_005869 [Thalictrum thalictroides]
MKTVKGCEHRVNPKEICVTLGQIQNEDKEAKYDVTLDEISKFVKVTSIGNKTPRHYFFVLRNPKQRLIPDLPTFDKNYPVIVSAIEKDTVYNGEPSKVFSNFFGVGDLDKDYDKDAEIEGLTSP